ncbi:prosaposin-like [Sycon ciliatum]|uniref:prosaposin-like n=1 Tax=Sycon ciliatum TaxID=27933 RepID=UPI0020A88932|eukprot:scpid98509/ scgid6710/ Proactivator polypeptide; Saposin-A; Saposin-B; Saposin-C; Saposin-D
MKVLIAFLALSALALAAQAQKNGEGCVLCKYVFNILEDELKNNNKTEAEIEAALDNVCSRYLPSSISSECQQLVNELGREFLKNIESVTAEQFCEYTKLCSATKSLKDLTMMRKLRGEEACHICEGVLTNVHNALSNHATEAEIEKVLSEVCTKVPSAVRTGCHLVVSLYGEKIISMLANDIKPAVICKDIHLC